MAWVEPQYQRDDVDDAGQTLVGRRWSNMEEIERCFNVINNWRAAHAFPLNTFQVYLRRKARDVDRQSVVAQRTKRLSSIDAKLKRFHWLRLSAMQDIGGCRAIVRNVRSVGRLVNLYHNSSIKHRLVDEDDYINQPKSSGYRGHHLIYCYYSDKKDTYNDLKIELQIRSSAQHVWATAVETVGTFTNYSLKSSEGDKDWLRFFALMSSAMALRERTPLVPGTPTNRTELIDELREYSNNLDVEAKLDTYRTALNIVRHPGLQGSHYFLLKTEPDKQTAHVTGYRFTEIELATADYATAEREIIDQPGAEAVLVSVSSLAALQSAYPNYFLDTTRFLRALREATSSRSNRTLRQQRLF